MLGCRTRLRFSFLLCTLPLLLPCASALGAEPEESVWHVPVDVSTPVYGHVRQSLIVVIVREAGTARRPFAVLLHGRPFDAAGRTALGQVNYPANARYLAGLGFTVLIPTRVGYGFTGGPDLEYTGDCANKDFTAALATFPEEVEQVLAFAAGKGLLDRSRGLVIGESFGGIGALALGNGKVAGVRGVVNISGGDGGDPSHVDEPCRPDQLARALETLGHQSRLPSLWMYSRNDRLWGPNHPAVWFDAYARSGGRGQFVALPADRNNGHYIFNRNAAAWHPAFEAFVAASGVFAGAPPGRP